LASSSLNLRSALPIRLTGSASVLIITTSGSPSHRSRYYEQVRQQCPDWELIEVGYDFAGNMLELCEFELGSLRLS
jgi:hypothetical protein